MKLDVNLKGFAELGKRLEEIATEAATAAGQSAIRAGAKVALASIKAETPSSDIAEGATTRHRRKSGKVVEDEHHKIVDNLKIKKIRTSNEHQVAVAITVGKAWHARFVEWGTIHQKPNAFMERGLLNVQQEIIDAIAKQLDRQIIKRGGPSDD